MMLGVKIQKKINLNDKHSVLELIKKNKFIRFYIIFLM